MTTTYRTQPDGIPVIDKSPVAVLDYPIDWALLEWLEPGETIVSQTVTADPGITVNAVNPLPSGAATLIQIWLSGGAVGTTYTVTCQITTSAGRTDERSFRLNCILR